MTNPTDNQLIETLNDWIRSGDTALVERLSELELQLENAGWVRQYDLNGRENEFSLSGLKTIARLARTFFLKNPLIQRGVNVQTDYTFGRGIQVTAKDESINEVLQQFVDDLKNQVEITSHQAMLQADRELQLDGNRFLVFFVHELTGRCRVRSISFQEIDDIICNPEDKKDAWFYKRVWQEQKSETEVEQKTAYYRDWQSPDATTDVLPKGATLADGLVFHIKTGGFSDWKFGVSEVYAALDWARAYKDFLTNWATLMAAYARFALKLSTKGGAAGVAKAKTKLNTTLSSSNGIDSNPPAVAGATFIEAQDQVALDVVKTAGATTKAEEGRRLALMVASAVGLPETMLTGDVSVGTLATAESMDRPTELRFSNRQEFWQSTWKRIIWFVIQCSVAAAGGMLRSIGSIETNEYGESQLVLDEGIEKEIAIDFPEIISISIKDHISAIISTVTLDGKQLALKFTPRYVSQLLLTALGVDDVDEILEQLFPDGTDGTEDQDDETQPATAALAKAIESLTEAMRNAVESEN